MDGPDQRELIIKPGSIDEIKDKLRHLRDDFEPFVRDDNEEFDSSIIVSKTGSIIKAQVGWRSTLNGLAEIYDEFRLQEDPKYETGPVHERIGEYLVTDHELLERIKAKVPKDPKKRKKYNQDADPTYTMEDIQRADLISSLIVGDVTIEKYDEELKKLMESVLEL